MLIGTIFIGWLAFDLLVLLLLTVANRGVEGPVDPFSAELPPRRSLS